jgi:DNA-binding transcriptional MerR regulator
VKPPKLTIGQLAAHAGVTVRAVRHYHQRGLLPEPERDASGYRRYDAQAVVDLIRIKTLSEAGVPLARIEQLLAADHGEFGAAISQIDQALRQKIRQLSQHRRRIAELGAGDRLFLPPQIAAVIEELRALGISERGIRMERDGWILMAASAPDLALQWAQEKLASLAEPEFRQIYVICDDAFDWDPADPRLDALARRMASWGADQPDRDQPPGDVPPVAELMSAEVATASPAWQRLHELSLGHAADAPD